MIKKYITFLLILLIIAISAEGQANKIIVSPAGIVNWGYVKGGSVKTVTFTVNNTNPAPPSGEADPNGYVICLNYPNVWYSVSIGHLKHDIGPYTQSLSCIVEYKATSGGYSVALNGGESCYFVITFTAPTSFSGHMLENMNFNVTSASNITTNITSPKIEFELDNELPSLPSVSISQTGATSIKATWSNCTDNYGISSYKAELLMNDVPVKAQTFPSGQSSYNVTFNNLGICNNYSVSVTAYDLAGNINKSNSGTIFILSNLPNEVVQNTNATVITQDVYTKANQTVRLTPGFKYSAYSSGGKFYDAFIYVCSPPLKSAVAEIQEDDETGNTTSFAENRSSENTVIPSKIVDDIDIDIYPVPSNETVTIKTTGIKTDNSSYEIFKMEGSMILSGKINSNETPIDISSLPAGIYVVKIKLDQTIIIRRIIKS